MALLDFRAIYLPYCIEQQDDESWLILNREYSPVGFNAAHIQPDGHPVTVKLKGLGLATLTKLAFDGKVQGKKVYLYDDECNPVRGKEHMQAYLAKIALLAKLEVA